MANNKINNDVLKDLITGDIILFSCKDYLMSEIIEVATSSIWSHIGIVVKDPDFLVNKNSESGLFLLNSNGAYEVDIETNTKRVGVQLVNLETAILDYDGLVVVRKLHFNDRNRNNDENERRNQIIKYQYETVFEKNYDYYPSDWIVTFLHNHVITLCDNFINTRHTDAVFCSALVAYIYTNLEVLDKNSEWSLFTPSYFAQNEKEHFNLNNSYLDKTEIIKDYPNVKNSSYCWLL